MRSDNAAAQVLSRPPGQQAANPHARAPPPAHDRPREDQGWAELDVGSLLRIRRYRRGFTRLLGTQMLRSLAVWMRYLDVAYPTKPADYAEYMAALRAKLQEPGRMAEFMKTGKSTPADAEAQLPNVTCPALIIMGSEEPDFADPRAEGDAIAAAIPAGLATVAMVDGAGHYPHAQSPDAVAALVIPFLKEHALA
jgi:pimeloyl-ACP methyl ester carboxylesterase